MENPFFVEHIFALRFKRCFGRGHVRYEWWSQKNGWNCVPSTTRRVDHWHGDHVVDRICHLRQWSPCPTRGSFWRRTQPGFLVSAANRSCTFALLYLCHLPIHSNRYRSTNYVFHLRDTTNHIMHQMDNILTPHKNTSSIIQLIMFRSLHAFRIKPIAHINTHTHTWPRRTHFTSIAIKLSLDSASSLSIKLYSVNRPIACCALYSMIMIQSFLPITIIRNGTSKTVALVNDTP